MAEHTQHGPYLGSRVVCIASDLGKSRVVFNIIAPVTAFSMSLTDCIQVLLDPELCVCVFVSSAYGKGSLYRGTL